jgi:radical SAM protein with 4Fe4S-binding SPASM domain
MRLTKIHSFPYTATVDVTNVCNLKCPFCPTGAKEFGRKPTFINLELVDDFLNQLDKYLILANLYSWGEPLLHPKIDEIVAKFHKRRIFTSISSNMNINNKSKLESICNAGLDYLIVSADGANQDVYSEYRRNGKFQLLIENLQHIVNYRNKKNLKKPIIEWQFLVFRHNEHQIEQAREKAKKMGADKFSFHGGVGPGKSQSLTPELKGNLHASDSYCKQLWHNISVQADGGITPCCHLYRKKDDFGNMKQERLNNIKNNKTFINARKLFCPPKPDSIYDSKSHPCMSCPLVMQQAHLEKSIKYNPNSRQWKDSIESLEVT